MLRTLTLVATILSLVTLAPVVRAADCGCQAGCGQRTVLVPTWVTETRTVKETHYRTEERQRECVTYKKVPVTKQVPCEYTVWVRKKVSEEQKYEVSTPRVQWVDQEYTCYEPGKETVTRIRMVTKCVPVKETRVVCEDQGQWVEKEVACCDPCGARVTRKVTCWEPNIVKKEVEVTVNKMMCVEEQYQCEIDVAVPIKKTRKVKQWDTVKEEKTKVHEYYTYEPKTRVKLKEVCVMECVPDETKIITEQVCVPYTVEKEVQVTVCKLVAKTVPCCCQ